MLARKSLGRTGIEVSSLGVGGFLGLLLDPEATPAQCEAAGVEAVRRAVELGVRYFDTSPAYGNGLSERHLAAGLAALDPEVRAGLTVSTKVGTHPERRYAYGADDVRWCFDGSRELLGAIDVVLVHDPATDEHIDTILGPGGAFDALEELKAGRGDPRHRPRGAPAPLPAAGHGVGPRRRDPALVRLPPDPEVGGAVAGRGRRGRRGRDQRLPLPVGPARRRRSGAGGAPVAAGARGRGAGPGDRRLVRGEGSRRGRRGRAVQPAGAPHRRHPGGTADGGGGGVLPGPRHRGAARRDLGGAGGVPRGAGAAPGARGARRAEGAQARPSSARTSETVWRRASWISSS